MNPRQPTHAPTSAQLERVREIIVGRQLGKIEQRLEQLENITPAKSAAVNDTEVGLRMEQLEAKFEAVRDAMQQQVDQVRHELGGEMVNRNHEVRRLAELIQQTAQMRAAAGVTPEDLAASEHRMHAWAAAWQQSLEQHLQQREQLWMHYFQQQWQRLHAHMAASQPPRETQQQIAAAAQALGHAAASLSQWAKSFSSPP
jgi:hypothetical protein